LGEEELEGAFITKLNDIKVDNGNVMHALRNFDPGFCGFGEAYFSWVKSGAVKAWKFHKINTMNLVVPSGLVKFVLFDEKSGVFRQEIIGLGNYARLTIPPQIWFGFKGVFEHQSLILSISDHPHQPDEVKKADQNQFDFSWSD
jgi:dTDP-4-dehydrorhamnose 3,5-epimerase